ncbi:hypothetical protein H0H92_001843 [Tricholoma furcatifolium]|nr:hypothetical protein H0H92_001843 [Tricholoma furcatifolium]
MATSRFSRLLGLKSGNTSSSRPNETDLGDEEWFIPYRGPIEPPRPPIRRQMERDSWGDPIEQDEEEYDSGEGSDRDHRGWMHPSYSEQAVSSGVVNVSRSSIVTQRRSTITSSHNPPSRLPPSGGVGESPAPPMHPQSSSKDGNRSSLAGFFSFASQTRTQTPEREPKFVAKKFATVGRLSSGRPSTGHRRSSSAGSNSVLATNFGINEYTSEYYFSSKVAQKTPLKSTGTRVQEETTPTSSGSDIRHPYSYAFPTRPSVDNGLQATPLILSNVKYVKAPILPVTEPRHQPFARVIPLQTGLKRLQNSVSTPDLRIIPRRRSPKLPLMAKVKDRWLSAETWCDAILFPRPRLKMKTPHGESSSDRIVSLPPSPVPYGPPGQSMSARVIEQGMPSRVLAHSRSLADLVRPPADPPFERTSHVMEPAVQPPKLHVSQPSDSGTNKPDRPKSWALDDLDLPTAVPSLAQVVEEGEKFEKQRKQWQDQATNSFQNKVTRSLSRARSKSLTQKGRKRDVIRPSNLDFLAARAYLGNQLLTPVVAEHRISETQDIHMVSLDTGQSNRASHSHSNSLAKTWSKSKSHSRGHSRSDSFGRALLKKARPADYLGSGDFITDNELENALRGDGTKVIRLADPARQPTPVTPSSPSGSLISDSRIGIALSTPPLVENPSNVEAVRLPAHPYAQGGLYSVKAMQVKIQEDEDMMGLQYVTPPSPAKQFVEADVSKRDSPPIALSHPYAQQSSSRNSYIPDTKFILSDIPAASKMWARLSPDALREVLPDEIQYSPFMPDRYDEPELEESNRNSQAIYDTAGVGEALAYAIRPMESIDSGLNVNEHVVAESSVLPQRSFRRPVQYDATLPPHLSIHNTRIIDPSSAHTFASSPFLHQQRSSPPPGVPSHGSYSMSEILKPPISPESSSPPHSPRSFGDPDNLEAFHDLFYDPNRPSNRFRITSETSYSSTSGPPLESHRIESGLTSLAQQLCEEFGLGQLTAEHSESYYSHASAEEPQPITRRPIRPTLEFVFEETSPPTSAMSGLSPPNESTMSPFHPSSEKIPEDVESSRSSSPFEPDVDENVASQCPFQLKLNDVAKGILLDTLRLGVLGSEVTSPAGEAKSQTSRISPDVRGSHLGGGEQMVQPRINSGLQLPSADPTRSSYLTTSSMSRISGLSDFPAPPPSHAEHMSILTSYFDETHSLSENFVSRNVTPPPIPASLNFHDITVDHPEERSNARLSFEGEEELEELVAALSSHSHSTTLH